MSEKNRRFITEKIQKPPLTLRQKAKKILTFLFLAVLFGAVAAVSFVLVRPAAERFLHPEPEETQPPVSIPQDEFKELPSPEETGQETSPEAETEPVRQIVEEAVKNYQYTIDDVDSMIGSLRGQFQKADASVVTVHSVQQDVDWFDNPVQTTGQYAGAIIAETETELLIMTPQAAAAQADSIRVTFSGGDEVDGRIKQQDTLSHIAIVSVEKEELPETAKESAVPFTLGNSYLLGEGDLLIAVGSPAGQVHSGDYGFISYIQKNMQMVDRTGRMIYSGIHADASAGTFLLNTDGELIGWAYAPEDGTQAGGMTEIIGISDYKGILEDLSNGLGAPCLGIQGQVVTNPMHEQGVPLGIYVIHAVVDRPVYNAGLQSGDVITKINGRESVSAGEFRNIMDNLKCGQLIHVTVARNGRDAYTELEFQVTVGAR